MAVYNYADAIRNATGYNPQQFDQSEFNYGQSIKDVVGSQGLVTNPPPVGATIDPQRLQPFKATLTDVTTPEEARHIPQATFSPGIYGDMAQQLVSLVQNVDILALSRPKNTRVMMIIYNSAAANLYIAFDQAANAGSLPIPPGGNLFFDNAVPQNDIHLFYAAGATTTVPIYYMNADIANLTA